ncbi:helix-turn-helix domain-containing protein [Streptomyces sp. NPDC048392]|uniref:helix-turn-helix domain-containing protein n=1 Tax=Streptomyces sp. NPDC048392 TaxID=3365543 RepID=UPI00371DD8A6
MIQDLPMYQLVDREDCDGRTFLRLLMERDGEGRKVSVRQLAEAAGVSSSMIGNLLTGKSTQLPYEAALRSAERLGVDCGVLWVQAARSVRSRRSSLAGARS